MDEIQLLLDLHRDGDRQGPGSAQQTRMAIALSCLGASRNLQIADIGSGTGAASLVLAQDLDATVTAVDFLQPFLDTLTTRAQDAGLADRIHTSEASMDALPFSDGSLDAIWSEGAIYNIGFETGIQSWRRFLKPGGILAVSELTWLTAVRPTELTQHWKQQYAGVATASTKIAQLEANGYALLGYFALPKSCWLQNYYDPMQNRFEGFLQRHGQSEQAKAIVAAEQAEIALYKRYSDYFSYGFYIAHKLPD